MKLASLIFTLLTIFGNHSAHSYGNDVAQALASELSLDLKDSKVLFSKTFDSKAPVQVVLFDPMVVIGKSGSNQSEVICGFDLNRKASNDFIAYLLKQRQSWFEEKAKQAPYTIKKITAAEVYDDESDIELKIEINPDPSKSMRIESIRCYARDYTYLTRTVVLKLLGDNGVHFVR